ncbi:p21-C-terminal region-binding protein-domain-containing protein [Dichomitus squalens]|uniref:Protein BCP1 n=1 Tax=Dichomitus squalens TaxID=114155 RepID=A0A4Q9MSD0_9APHY|nr:p21-C-terminal region-binding protein-domain-containing protein [Dichomitus squalens]
MAKRKQQAEKASSDNESDSERSLVDVDFEFFDPNADIDYLATKRLLTQLFNADAQDLPLHDLADLILSQPLVGTTVKCDGKESDPYAFLTVLNLNVHKDRPSIKALIAYILEKSSADPVLHSKLQTLLGPTGLASSDHVGFIFSERLINMPVQIMPHMYRMLADEIQWALDDNEPYDFKHLLIISRIYRLTAEEAAELQASAPPTKRQKQSNPPPAAGVYPFHPEDDYIRRFATHTLDYTFTHSQPRDADSFGLDIGGRMALVPATRLRDLAATLAEAYPQPS